MLHQTGTHHAAREDVSLKLPTVTGSNGLGNPIILCVDDDSIVLTDSSIPHAGQRT